jgi:hypothetical protein
MLQLSRSHPGGDLLLMFDRLSFTTCDPRDLQLSGYSYVVNITHSLFSLSHVVDSSKTIAMAVCRFGAKVGDKAQRTGEKFKDALRLHASDAGGNPKAPRPLGISTSVKLMLKVIKESSDAFPPLKSVASGLDFICTNVEVRKCALEFYNLPYNLF